MPARYWELSAALDDDAHQLSEVDERFRLVLVPLLGKEPISTTRFNTVVRTVWRRDAAWFEERQDDQTTKFVAGCLKFHGNVLHQLIKEGRLHWCGVVWRPTEKPVSGDGGIDSEAVERTSASTGRGNISAQMGIEVSNGMSPAIATGSKRARSSGMKVHSAKAAKQKRVAERSGGSATATSTAPNLEVEAMMRRLVLLRKLLANKEQLDNVELREIMLAPEVVEASRLKKHGTDEIAMAILLEYVDKLKNWVDDNQPIAMKDTQPIVIDDEDEMVSGSLVVQRTKSVSKSSREGALAQQRNSTITSIETCLPDSNVSATSSSSGICVASEIPTPIKTSEVQGNAAGLNVETTKRKAGPQIEEQLEVGGEMIHTLAQTDAISLVPDSCQVIASAAADAQTVASEIKPASIAQAAAQLANEVPIKPCASSMFAFALNDQVIVTSAHECVPEGTIGEVVGFTQIGVQVRLSCGTCADLPGVALAMLTDVATAWAPCAKPPAAAPPPTLTPPRSPALPLTPALSTLPTLAPRPPWRARCSGVLPPPPTPRHTVPLHAQTANVALEAREALKALTSKAPPPMPQPSVAALAPGRVPSAADHCQPWKQRKLQEPPQELPTPFGGVTVLAAASAGAAALTPLACDQNASAIVDMRHASMETTVVENDSLAPQMAMDRNIGAALPAQDMERQEACGVITSTLKTESTPSGETWAEASPAVEHVSVGLPPMVLARASFLANLPAKLSVEEVALRGVVLSFLVRWENDQNHAGAHPITADLEKDIQVQAIIAKTFPQGGLVGNLKLWIRRRLKSEVQMQGPSFILRSAPREKAPA